MPRSFLKSHSDFGWAVRMVRFQIGYPYDAALRFGRFHAMQLRNRDTVEGKIGKMLDRFSFGPLVEVIETSLGTPIPCN